MTNSPRFVITSESTEAINCSCAEFGCKFTSTKENEVWKHVETQCHFSAVRDTLEKQKNEIVKLKKENELLRKQLREQRGDERPIVQLKRPLSATSKSPKTPSSPAKTPVQPKLLSTTKGGMVGNRTISPNIDLSKPIILTPTNVYEQFRS